MTFSLISVLRRIQELDARIATWPRLLLSDSMKRAYAAGLCLHVTDKPTGNCALAAKSTAPWTEPGQIHHGPSDNQVVSLHVNNLILLGRDSTGAAGQGSGSKDGGLRGVVSPAEGNQTGHWQSPAPQAPRYYNAPVPVCMPPSNSFS